MSSEESKKIVLKRFSQAVIQLDWGHYSIRSQPRRDDGAAGSHLGGGKTEEAAWCDAEGRISTAAPMHDHSEIQVWRFEDAPEQLRALSTNGGDEDWLAFIPEPLADKWIGWLESPHFGCCDVDEFPIRGGVVRIGSHA